MEFDGQAYNQRGVLLVMINYRVGALGFLAHPWLAGENKDGVSIDQYTDPNGLLADLQLDRKGNPSERTQLSQRGSVTPSAQGG